MTQKYKIWEWDMEKEEEYVMARNLTLKEAEMIVKISPENLPRRYEKEEIN